MRTKEVGKRGNFFYLGGMFQEGVHGTNLLVSPVTLFKEMRIETPGWTVAKKGAIPWMNHAGASVGRRNRGRGRGDIWRGKRSKEDSRRVGQGGSKVGGSNKLETTISRDGRMLNADVRAQWKRRLGVLIVAVFEKSLRSNRGMQR